MTVNAVYENGVFRPTEPVASPEGAAVRVELPPAAPPDPDPGDHRFAHLEPGLAGVYAILARRHDGSPGGDILMTHDDHQADDPPDEAEAHRRRVFAILGQSFDLGDPELAARHNEHQP